VKQTINNKNFLTLITFSSNPRKIFELFILLLIKPEGLLIFIYPVIAMPYQRPSGTRGVLRPYGLNQKKGAILL